MLAEQTRARATDPITSHLAAERAGRFAGTHSARILAALHQSTGRATAQILAHGTGLTVVQVARRLPELERDGKVRVATAADGQELHDGRYRLWELAS